MVGKLSSLSVLCATPWCVAREQEDRILVYNVRTDEMHLIPPTGYYVYQLCDGLRTVGQLEREIARAIAGPDEVSIRVREFLEQLVARGILTIDDGE